MKHATSRHPRPTTAVARIIAAAVGVVATALVVAPTAYAALTYQVTNYDADGTSGVYLRNSANINDVVRDSAHYVTYGTSINLICGTFGSPVGPYANTAWDRVQVVNGPNAGKVGYISEHWVNTPVTTNQHVPGEPDCNAPPPPPPPPPSGPYVSHAVAIRYCVNTAVAGCGTSLSPGYGGASAATPTIPASQTVSMVCWQDGSNFTGDYTTNRWFWVQSSGGAVGFVSASYVKNQIAVSACSTNRGIYAAETAALRYGQTTASAADRQLFLGSEWSPGDVGEWSGDCPKLPYVGWKAVGVSIRKNNAIVNYNNYKNAGLIHTSGTPPVGAVVFYNLTSAGHENIYIGNGMSASTQGIDDGYKPNVIRPYRAWANYLGWYQP